LTLLLKHIMLSHHGEYEFGSPKRPKIPEALVINYLDDLSAKINNFQSTLKKENVMEGEWSSFSKMHDRYLYRHAAYADGGAAEAGSGIENKGAQPQDLDSSGRLPLDI
jgi:3'-5' exoribonuclease